MDFDPEVLSLADVLEVFWNSHNPFAAARGPQYMTAVFSHNDDQRREIEADVARLEEERGGTVTTKRLSYGTFHLAEDYHQKYMLRRHPEFEAPLLEAYPSLVDFVNSTAAARLNGYVGGHGSREAMARDLPRLGLSDEARERLLNVRR